MIDLRSELKRLNPVLYAAFERSLEIATHEWLPLIPAKNDSHNANPHLLNIEHYISAILYEDDNKEYHGFELNGSELYVMLSSILFHDIGKGWQSDKKNSFHASDSLKIITNSWAKIRIESEQFAKIISLVCLYHDCDAAEWDKLQNSLSNFMYVDHYGRIRARSIAALLYLADHMDGTYTRAVPDYMIDEKLGKKDVGGFRGKTQSVRADLRNKMVCTILEINNIEEKKDFLNIEKYRCQILGKSVEEYERLKSAGNKDFISFADPERQKQIKEHGVAALTGNTLQNFLADNGSFLSEEKPRFPQSKAINLIVKDVYINNSALGKIRNELYEMGMPLLEWFIECNSVLFKPEDTRNTNDAKMIRSELKLDCPYWFFECKKAIEPVLNKDMLMQTFNGIVKITSGSFGEKYFDYYTLLNYMCENDKNIHKIKCAVKRLSLLLESGHSGVRIYYDEVVWSLSISALDKIKQVIRNTELKQIKYTTEPDIESKKYLIRLLMSMTKVQAKRPSSGNTGNTYSYDELYEYVEGGKLNDETIKNAAKDIATLTKSEECRDYIDIECFDTKWKFELKTKDLTKKFIAGAFEIIADTVNLETSLAGSDPNQKNDQEEQLKPGFAYDKERSIIFSDNLDILLCKHPNHESLNRIKANQNDIYKDKDGNVVKTWEKYSKYEIFEIISRCEKCVRKKGFDAACSEECDHRHAFLPKDRCKYLGGLVLPQKKENRLYELSDSEYFEQNYSNGSGNIIIVGGYGTGKSTLAFQMAAACADEINRGISVYYSLESTRRQTIENFVINPECLDSNSSDETKKTINKKIKLLNYLDMYGEDSSLTSDRLYDRFSDVLKNSDNEITPQILFPLLSPRGVEVSENASTLFAKRYKELEYMLQAIKIYNNKHVRDNCPQVKLVVIDSLNVFSEKPLMREEVNRLLELFTRNNILGVFTLEDCVQEDIVGGNYIGSIKYKADVVISLKTSYFNHHKETFFEVEKSRNVYPIAGHHLYKIRENQNFEERPGNVARKKLEVYPSLHYILSATATKMQGKLVKNPNNIFGIPMLEKVLPQHVMLRDAHWSQVITITGDSGLYKSDLAINALLFGMTLGENGMLIRLNDRDLFEEDGVRLSQDVYEMLLNRGMEKDRIIFKRSDDEQMTTGYKIKRTLWTYSYYNDLNQPAESTLVEIVFKSGALLPEEFVNDICHAIDDYKIKRVAFIDLKTIGISYPFLINSETSGDMFISAFVHLMRNYGVHLLMSSTNSAVQESDKEVKKACGLSDAVITCETKDNEVYVSGVGGIGNGKKYRFTRYWKMIKPLEESACPSIGTLAGEHVDVNNEEQNDKKTEAHCIYFTDSGKRTGTALCERHTPKIETFKIVEEKYTAYLGFTPKSSDI